MIKKPERLEYDVINSNFNETIIQLKNLSGIVSKENTIDVNWNWFKKTQRDFFELLLLSNTIRNHFPTALINLRMVLGNFINKLSRY